MSIFDVQPDPAPSAPDQAPPPADPATPADQAPQAAPAATDGALFTIGERQFSAEDAVKKIVNADTHIQKLETESADQRKQIDELMEKLTQLTKGSGEPVAAPATQAADPAASVAEQVRLELTKAREAEQAHSNEALVSKALSEKFGEKAHQALLDKAASLGLDLPAAQALAQKSPQAVLAWFQAPSAGPAPTTSSVNRQALEAAAGASNKGTYNDWAQLRKADPKAYFSPSMTKQRMADAARLGSAFFN